MRVIVAAVLLAVCAVGANAAGRYDGYQLLRVHPEFPGQWKVVAAFKLEYDLDVWSEGPGYIDVFVPPQRLNDVRRRLVETRISYNVQSDRIQQDIDEEAARLASRRLMAGKAINYDDFNTYTDISAELDALALRCPSAVTCSTFSVGNSFLGLSIKGLRITGTGAGRRGIWLDATTHAREWLSTATHLKIVRHLVDDYATDTQVQSLVNTYDWHLVPVINPDGYEFTWTSPDNRLWRKNRSPNAGSVCVGTDLNRNFEEKWGNAGTSTSPCSETYGGTGPASEVETQAVQNNLLSLGASLKTSMHFHTYGQLWLIPWGSVDALNNCNFATDHAELLVVANAGANAVEATWGTTWARGNSCATIYPASGITMDYAKARAGVKYTTTPELRGTNFIIAPSEIEPSFQEVWNGLVATINAIP